MRIGILKDKEDSRVALLPDAVLALTKLNVSIMLEASAGVGAYVSDKEYEEVGVTIGSEKEVIRDSEILLKVEPVSKDLAAKLKEGQVVVSVMNPFFNTELVKLFKERKITTFGMDIIPRTTRAQAMDVLSSMATVAGYKAVLDAAARLPKFFMMFMSAAGTIRPAKVLVLGAGVAGLQAIATSRKLGAVVEVFDVRAAVKEEVMSLGGRFIEVEGAKDDISAGGYAVEQTAEFKQKQQQMIQDHAIGSHVVICTAQIPGRKAPLLITKDTVGKMNPGSVVIDLAASTGGNCELTKNNEAIIYDGVTVVGNSAYPSDMPSDASRMFGKNLINFLTLIIDQDGNLNLDFEDEIIAGTCLTHDNVIVNERVKEFINNK